MRRQILSFSYIVVVVGVVLAMPSRGIAQQPHDTPVTSQPSSEPDRATRTGSSESGSQEVPDYITYRIFFSHVDELDLEADKLDAQGKDGNDLRTHDQRLSGLTDGEAALMKQIAHDCNQNLQTQKAKVHEDIEAYRAQNHAHAGSMPPGEMEKSIEMRNETVTSHLAELRSALGENSFQKLDKYVRNMIQPKLITAPIAKPARTPNLDQSLHLQ
jgi:transglutaminase/protease-like cytokinesis protein 3